jgi:hypothetical protein
MTEPEETGAASMLIDLSNGVITVTHGTDHVVLRQWTARKGHWDRLWTTISTLESEGSPT